MAESHIHHRLYEAVLDMTRLPESQLIMMLENPDPTVRVASLWKALMDNVGPVGPVGPGTVPAVRPRRPA